MEGIMTTRILWLAIAIFSAAAAVQAEQSADVRMPDANQAIVQIGGRQCEYHRSEVEGALRRFDAVQQVDFLNNHGTVRVTYRSNGLPPEHLAEAVERALAMGWGCKAWIER